MKAKHQAVALGYGEGEASPKVLASGQGELALKLIAKAKEFNVPLFQNEALAQSLLGVDVQTHIPPALYEAVVEVFVWLHNSEKKAQLSKA